MFESKPVDNCVCEVFNGSLRRECLSQHWFATLAEAQLVLDPWRKDYNNHRPHTTPGYHRRPSTGGPVSSNLDPCGRSTSGSVWRRFGEPGPVRQGASTAGSLRVACALQLIGSTLPVMPRFPHMGYRLTPLTSQRGTRGTHSRDGANPMIQSRRTLRVASGYQIPRMSALQMHHARLR